MHIITVNILVYQIFPIRLFNLIIITRYNEMVYHVVLFFNDRLQIFSILKG